MRASRLERNPMAKQIDGSTMSTGDAPKPAEAMGEG